MIVVDDLLVRPFVSLLGILRSVALNELYDVEELRDELKENQLLYEIGERTQEEYERRKNEIELRIALAEQVRSQVRGRVEIKGQ
jgi:hypothetical protein